ncbi:MAG: hypothetical protein ACRELA_22075, partial [Candidatus Rokuibacteriota bacterium]
GVIRPTATEARLHGQFFLDTQAGREHFAVIRNLGRKGQWSYGYDVLETGALSEELQARGVRRVLKSLDVHEASPVLLGAGIDTRTVATKTSLKADEPAAALLLHTDGGYSDAAWDGATQEATMDVAKLRVSSLAFVAGDPDVKTNYQLLYRDGEGRVNSNAVRTIQARLAQTDLPAGIRADVEQHAAKLLALVQAHDEAGKQLRQEIDAGLQTFERTQRQFGG